MLGNIKDPEKKLTTQDLQTLITDNQQQYNKLVQRKRSEKSLADWKARQERKKYNNVYTQPQQVDPSTLGTMGRYHNFG
tara:strand:- start:443 stop:679 length:237 start_codon:yes stop_codon:yes gene_type:complete